MEKQYQVWCITDETIYLLDDENKIIEIPISLCESIPKEDEVVQIYYDENKYVILPVVRSMNSILSLLRRQKWLAIFLVLSMGIILVSFFILYVRTNKDVTQTNISQSVSSSIVKNTNSRMNSSSSDLEQSSSTAISTSSSTTATPATSSVTQGYQDTDDAETIPSSDNSINTQELAQYNFASLRGLWRNGYGHELEFNENGLVSDDSTLDKLVVYDNRVSMLLSSVNGPSAVLQIYPKGTVMEINSPSFPNFVDPSDSTRDRIVGGQVPPTSDDDFYYRVQTTSGITVSKEPVDITVEELSRRENDGELIDGQLFRLQVEAFHRDLWISAPNYVPSDINFSIILKSDTSRIAGYSVYARENDVENWRDGTIAEIVVEILKDEEGYDYPVVISSRVIRY
ncbi:TPA: hypothetical protein ACGO8N_001098 [Streptococcus suis]